MVLNDRNVPPEIRKARARALEALGSILENVERAEGEECPVQQKELEKVAFHAMLDTVWRQEMAARHHGIDLED
jgi:hypothetical protein